MLIYVLCILCDMCIYKFIYVSLNKMKDSIEMFIIYMYIILFLNIFFIKKWYFWRLNIDI